MRSHLVSLPTLKPNPIIVARADTLLPSVCTSQVWDVIASAPLDLAGILWAVSTDKANANLITFLHSVSSYTCLNIFPMGLDLEFILRRSQPGVLFSSQSIASLTPCGASAGAFAILIGDKAVRQNKKF